LGDIKPGNVFISRDERVKVASIHSFPHETTNFAKLLSENSPSYEVLLAPEDLDLARDNKPNNYENDKSEVFSMATTIISAGLLDPLTSIYDYPSRKFLNEAYVSRTNEWMDSPHYTEIFKSIILSMGNPQPESRMSLDDLWNFVHQYEGSILDRQQFVINNPP
jgi:serine/threonine protein kinase